MKAQFFRSFSLQNFLKQSKTFSFFVVFLTSFSSSLYPTTLEKEAHAWVYTYIYHHNGTPRISKTDIQAITNLIYWSWCRSEITLLAQHDALEMVNTSWKLFQNIAQKRIDPSIDSPYTLSTQQEASLSHLAPLVAQHNSIGNIYAYAFKMIHDKQIVHHRVALDGIATLRSRARTVILESLINIRKQLGELFNLKLEKKDADFFSDQLTKKEVIQTALHKGMIINLLEYIYDYVPQLAQKSFEEANSMHNKVSEDAWIAIKKIQDIGNQTWKSIEEARTEFYEAYYTALVSAINEHGPQESLLLMFNEQGIIDKEDQKTYLPDIHELDFIA